MTASVFVDADPEAKLVRIGDEYVCPSLLHAVIEPDDESLPICRLTVRIEDGRPSCAALLLERRPSGQALSGSLLRRIPLADLVTQAVDAAASWLLPSAAADGADHATVTWPDGETYPLPVVRFDENHVAAQRIVGLTATASYRRATRAPRVAGAIGDEMLEEVADVYRRALLRREGPTEAVRQEWTVSRSTASRWVAKARERGFLPPARPRMPGELD